MDSLQPLSELRNQIDSIDEQILTLLNRRAEIAKRVAQTKIAAGEKQCFYRPDREATVLRQIKDLNRGPLPNDSVVFLFRELMSACLALEKPLKVAFLGPEGTFTQQAAHKHFGQSIHTLSLNAIDEVFREVESGAAEFGVVPVENSTEGVITHTLDSFLNSPLLICGEAELRIHHNLMSKNTEIDEIKEIFSHQQSFAQCREWLDRTMPGIKRTAVSSNAEAARMADVTPNSGAVAGQIASDLYGLKILAKNIEDEPDNSTRFLVIGRLAAPATGNDKTSLLLSTGNQPGALYHILAPFSENGVSLTKIESRPSRRGSWNYVFFVDFDGHQKAKNVEKALEGVRKQVSLLKILGSYPRAII